MRSKHCDMHIAAVVSMPHDARHSLPSYCAHELHNHDPCHCSGSLFHFVRFPLPFEKCILTRHLPTLVSAW